MATLESLPVELISDILSELDLETLVIASNLSTRLRSVTSDPALNPWRRPISRFLHAPSSENTEKDARCLVSLSVRQYVPRQNWIGILSMAEPSFILLSATIPHLNLSHWEECFRRRFLPSWVKWKKDGSWREVYFLLLHRVWHRSRTFCSSEESWTKYIVLNRNGSANELESAARSFSALAIFDQLKIQANLAQYHTRARLVVNFADVRIIAIGVLRRTQHTYSINDNARSFLHPPGIERTFAEDKTSTIRREEYDTSGHHSLTDYRARSTYTRLAHPAPLLSHCQYPLYTPGGRDTRWIGDGADEEEGMYWVGPLMVTAQITGGIEDSVDNDLPLRDLDLLIGPGHNRFASFVFQDFLSIAPWMEDRITKFIQGPGLGN